MLPPGGSLTSASTGEVDENASEQDKARAAAEAEAARADALRRERRKVIALNRLGDAALHVRRDFVSKLLARPAVVHSYSPVFSRYSSTSATDLLAPFAV
jgi:hypothetical protein